MLNNHDTNISKCFLSHIADTLVFVVFKFLHCADLHLDAVLRNAHRASDHDELSSIEIQKMRDAPLNALESISQHAIENQVDAVVIAGDIFDKKENTTTNLRARSRFTNFLEKLDENSIEVLIALGNHDPLDSINELKISWPKNTYVFSSTSPETVLKSFGEHKVAFHGVSYKSDDECRDLASLFPQKVSGSVNVGVLHTNVGSNSNHSNYAPSSLEKLTSFGYDYFALGHIHKREILNSHPMVAYSGNAQGLSAKPAEQEPKGCVLITINSAGSEATSIFLSCDSVRFTEHNLSYENIESTEELINEVNETLNEVNNENVLYLSRVYIQLDSPISNLDTDALRLAINDSRNRTIITRLKVEFTDNNWEELIDSDPFFAELDQLICDTNEIDYESIYGSKATNITSALGDDQNTTIDKDDIVQYVLSTHAKLKSKK